MGMGNRWLPSFFQVNVVRILQDARHHSNQQLTTVIHSQHGHTHPLVVRRRRTVAP